MSTNEPEGVREIVIVRRRADGDHDDHHGGVWKVAFADFMTAMMAFFLVLWIVNSTTKQTRSSLARYFNPIRLSDTTPARKGLNDPREVDFDASSDGSTQIGDETHDAPRPENSPLAAPKTQSKESRPRSLSRAAGPPIEDNSDDSEPTFPGMKSKSRANSNTERQTKKGANDAASVRAEIVAGLGDAIGREELGALTVTESPEGVLINLTDRSDAVTFAVGSSAAEGKLVRWLEAIARVLKGRSGALVVRGHTDSRQFKGGGDDNWRLSFARAQAAFFGLVRGGIDERRIEKVEAYADRMPINAQSPNARENRRIEILLRRVSP
ncbi:MAG: flagellar motor protein MotB [Rhodoblastus sp.]